MEEILRQIRWSGTTRGLVRNLKSFNKKFHTVPDAATPAAEAFLGKLVAPDLAQESEEFFQKTRAALNFKRREISLSNEGGRAVLETKDFTLEWLYALAPEAPSEWTRTLALSGVKSRSLLEKPEFDALFADTFETLEFYLSTPVQVEAVIDAVEAAAEKHPSSTADAAAATELPPISIEYPSNCSRCTLHVGGTNVAAVFTGDILRMEFPSSKSPRALADEFAQIRPLFAINLI